MGYSPGRSQNWDTRVEAPFPRSGWGRNRSPEWSRRSMCNQVTWTNRRNGRSWYPDGLCRSIRTPPPSPPPLLTERVRDGQDRAVRNPNTGSVTLPRGNRVSSGTVCRRDVPSVPDPPPRRGSEWTHNYAYRGYLP